MAQLATKLVRFLAGPLAGEVCTINASDFDASIHGDPEAKPKKPAKGSDDEGAGGAGAKGSTDTTPGPIASVNSAKALELIAEVDSLEALDKLEADERASEKHSPGRKGVLAAIEERRAALKG